MVRTLWDSITDALTREVDYRQEVPGRGGLLQDMNMDTPASVSALQAVGDYIPGYGDVLGAVELGKELAKENPNYVAAGLLGAGTAVGLVPGVGDYVGGQLGGAGRAIVERANQRGPVRTMYSNPIGRAADDAPQGIRAFHGSPYDFDRFSMEKIGTGEGAQAYGHGLYFAENEGVARGYRDALSGNRMDSAVFTLDDGVSLDPSTSSILRKNNGDIDAAISELRSRAENSPLSSVRSQANERAAFLDANRDSISFNPSGRMYEVNIAANPEDFLDWDLPLSEQPQSVLDAITPMVEKRLDDLEAAGQRARMIASEKGIPDFTPKSREQLYREMRGGDIVGASRLGQFDEAAEDILSGAGVPGIKYLDQGSRAAGEGSRNYVVFDENLIEIVRKYGIAGAAAMLGMTVAELQSQMGQAQAQPQGLLE